MWLSWKPHHYEEGAVVDLFQFIAEQPVNFNNNEFLLENIQSVCCKYYYFPTVYVFIYP